MASLGNLFFEILYRDDPKQLEEIKEGVSAIKGYRGKSQCKGWRICKGFKQRRSRERRKGYSRNKSIYRLKNAIENISNAYSEEIRRLTELRQLQRMSAPR